MQEFTVLGLNFTTVHNFEPVAAVGNLQPQHALPMPVMPYNLAQPAMAAQPPVGVAYEKSDILNVLSVSCRNLHRPGEKF